MLIKGTGIMGIEIVEDQSDFLSVGIELDQFLNEDAELKLPSLLAHMCYSLSAQGFNSRQDAASAMPLIYIFLLIHFARLHGQPFDFISNQEARALVKTYHGILRIIRQEVEPKNQLHAG